MSAVVDVLRKVRAVVLRQGIAAQDADDILQEAFARLEAYARTHEVRSREAFLVTAARNLSRDQARRLARSQSAADEIDFAAIADPLPQPEECLRARERLRRANSGLARLDALTRRCLFAQRLDGLTFAQIAAREGLSVAAVEKRVARAVMFLTQWVDEP